MASDIFSKCFEFRDKQRIISERHKDLAEKILFDTSPVDNFGPWMEKDGKKFLQFSTNDYLGLTNHPDVRAAAVEAVTKYSISGPMGARPLTGNTDLHRQLEDEVADFKKTEACITFSTGAGAMMGAIGCLTGPDDVAVMDQFAHASLVCGARISRTDIKFFKHNDAEDLEKVLSKIDPSKKVAVIIDGVYSMHGDIAPIPEIIAVKDRYGARLIIDDAHGTGVNGENGRGTAERLNCEGGIDLHMGTFSKAFAVSGGFVAGAKAVVDYVRFNAQTMLFTKAASAAVVMATTAAVKASRREPERRVKLWENTRRLQDGLRELGIDFGSTQTPITPIRMHGLDALVVSAILREKYGIWAAFVTYPAIRLGTSILRIIANTNHTKEHIDMFLGALKELQKEFPKSLSPGNSKS